MGLCASNSNKKSIKQSQLRISQTEQNNLKQSETQLTKHTKTAIPSLFTIQNPNFVRDDNDPPTPQSLIRSFNVVPDNKKSLDFKIGFFKSYSVITKNQDDNTLICQHNKTGELVLVYCLDPNNNQDKQFIKSIKQNQNDNFNICQFIEIFNENKSLYLIQEYCKGTKLSKLQVKDQSNILYIMSQLVSILNQLKMNHQYHGRLTIDSFSLIDDQNYYVKLTDIRPIFHKNQNNQTSLDNDQKQLYNRYQPPFEHPSNKTDVFSLGVIFHQLITQKLPERIKNIDDDFMKLKLEKENDPQIFKLLQSMLELDSAQRISIQQLNQYKLLNIIDNKKLISEILQKILDFPPINNFQKAILTYMISTFQTQESKIHKNLFQILDQKNQKYLNQNTLQQLCEGINIDQVNDNMDFHQNKDDLYLEKNENKILENDFLLSMSNRDKLLTDDYLENCYNLLKNQNGLLSAKSIHRKFPVNQNEIHQDLEKLSFNAQITLNEFKEIMLLLK